VRLPGVLKQVALAAQPPLLVAHSLMSAVAPCVEPSPFRMGMLAAGQLSPCTHQVPPRPSQRSHVSKTQAVWCGTSRHDLHSRPPVQVLPVPVKPGLQVHTGVLPELVQVASGLQPPLLTAQAPAFGQQQARVEAASQPHDGRVCAGVFHHCKQRHQDKIPCSCPPHSHHTTSTVLQAGE
jgi:hypothetical protein